MSTTTEAPPAATAAATPGRGGKRRLVLAAVALAAVAAAVAAYLLLFRAPPGEPGPPPPPAEGEVAEVATMTFNLAGAAGRYARVGFAVVLAEGVDPTTVSARFPLVKDAALSEVGTHSAESLRTPEGVDALRQGLTARAVELYPDGEVLRVVLTELVVQ